MADSTPTDSPHSDFEGFFRREYPNLSALATIVSGDPAVGEDLAQEALTRAQRQWSKISGYDKPGAWARRVTLNLALSRRRRMSTELRTLTRLKSQPQRGSASSEQQVFRLHGDPEIWEAVAQLPPKQRAVIALHYLEDRSVADIADLLEISVSAATSNLHKARTALATSLARFAPTTPTPTNAAQPHEGETR